MIALTRSRAWRCSFTALRRLHWHCGSSLSPGLVLCCLDLCRPNSFLRPFILGSERHSTLIKSPIPSLDSIAIGIGPAHCTLALPYSVHCLAGVGASASTFFFVVAGLPGVFHFFVVVLGGALFSFWLSCSSWLASSSRPAGSASFHLGFRWVP